MEAAELGLPTSVGPSHKTPDKSATYRPTVSVKWQKAFSVKMKHICRNSVPLLAGADEADKSVTNPDGARTTPGWPMPTGPSRPIMSDSFVLLALKEKTKHQTEIVTNSLIK